jgi:8-oxo-dGTP pyrophosphatase MutT (NUDIX family)
MILPDQLPPFARELAATPTLVERLRAVLSPPDDQPALDTMSRPRSAAVLLPLYDRDGVPHLLFTRRAATLRAHRGEISFPGGSRDPADQSLCATARRESSEELGLDPARVQLLGALDPVFTVVSNFLVTPIVGFLPQGPGPLRPNPAEVAAIIEVPLPALADPAIFHVEHWSRNGIIRSVYFFDYQSLRIWGVTARIVYDLLCCLAHDHAP